MHEYGTTEEHLASVAVKNHANGQLNPRAHFEKETTIEEVLDSPPIADPFRLLDCCVFSDGASAVVASPEAADSFDEPVDITGLGHATGIVPLADKESLTATQAARDAATDAYDQVDIRPDNVDFGEVHDCFTGAEILATESVGLFKDGEGDPVAAAGRTALNGEVPINSSGGLKAKGGTRLVRPERQRLSS